MNKADQALHFWPNSKFNIKNLVSSKVSVSKVESVFDQIYAPYKTVLFSSARTGLFHILKILELGRADSIWTMDYTSHCVLNVISFLTNPGFGPPQNHAQYLLHHQLGHLKKFSKNLPTIEDSADSLLTDSSVVFSNNSNFELVSLPKVFNTCFGGLVICKTSDLAERLKDSREKSSFPPHILGLLRAFKGKSSHFLNAWEGCEPYGAKLAPFMVANIYESITEFEHNLHARKNVLRIVRDETDLGNPTESRLPTAIPIPIANASNQAQQLYPQLVRHIYSDKIITISSKPTKHFLIPVHQQVSEPMIKIILKSLRDD